ncbi:MAG: glycoside hydrolase family 97 protein [Terrimonas ferruginea]|uniref:glycoside hydrolase family 97 protein n=1 Tax=Terrimonas ferruginea TaxID=249 RepID=UPI000929913B|nr:glycoside hydrolase family 97 protein [Terrimonas ferruginea]MBN8782210.1 glycoside hydrolase family 97 protein [Terrimonas ferruginea]OJW42742.1 MAG: alpha-glucosidase [Sphingobacteriales bacterium 48-107]
MRLKTLLALLLALTASAVLYAQQSLKTFSPSGYIQLETVLNNTGELQYRLLFKNKEAVGLSSLGLRLSTPAIELNRFSVVNIDSTSKDETWETVWGEDHRIRNNYREIAYLLQNKSSTPVKLRIVFRVFNDGVGFRYEFPQQDALHHFVVADELTGFAMTGDHKTFWIPGDYDTNEYAYYTSPLSKIDASGGGSAQEIHAKTFFDKNAVQTPLMMKSADGLYLNIHEAALLNYPAMNLVLDKATLKFHTQLVPDAVGNKAYLQTPAKTPWRTVLVSDKAPDILSSRTILNLNDPSVIGDSSWIHPQKYVGIWWEMHVGKSSWDYSGSQVGSQQATRVPHGANTANVKRYIDFAARHGFDGVLVEGWNTGWEDWFGQWKEDVFDFVTPYPDFNVQELSDYAKSKKVKIIMHHETSGSVTNYERWMDTAYRFMKRYNYDAVKTGYVGRIIPRGEHHDGQWMVRHFERVARKTAGYKIMVNMHESVRLTGLHRTFPNWIASEAARGNEFNAWSSGNPPEHETILPFTRLMGGPMDYTPGIFKIKMSYYDSTKKEQVHTTLTKQLALYVTMYSPLQMAADLPENYEANLPAFQFIKDVAADWEETRILDAEPGDYIITARKARGKDSWFIGAITDESARQFTTSLHFLDAGKTYIATIYRDADNADWKSNPEAYVVEKFVVTAKMALKLKLAPGGGTAISLLPATAAETKGIKKYK